MLNLPLLTHLHSSVSFYIFELLHHFHYYSQLLICPLCLWYHYFWSPVSTTISLPLPDECQLTGEDVFWFVEFPVWFNINRAQFKPWTTIHTHRDLVSTRLFSLSLNSSLCCLFGDDCSKTVAEALGELGQSISEASFNVPSGLHASPSGFQRSFCFLWFILPVFR